MHIDVIGLPAPQGSKRHVGKGIMVESSKKVKPWRQDVKYAALEVINAQSPIPFAPMSGPLRITVMFYLPRPKGHYRTGANAAMFRDNAPTFPAGRPDLDKLLRSTLDAIGESGCWGDDAQVVKIHAGKHYADHRQPGAIIRIEEAS